MPNLAPTTNAQAQTNPHPLREAGLLQDDRGHWTAAGCGVELYWPGPDSRGWSLDVHPPTTAPCARRSPGNGST